MGGGVLLSLLLGLFFTLPPRTGKYNKSLSSKKTVLRLALAALCLAVDSESVYTLQIFVVA